MGGYGKKRTVGTGLAALAVALSVAVSIGGPSSGSGPKLGIPGDGFDIATEAFTSIDDSPKRSERFENGEKAAAADGTTGGITDDRAGDNAAGDTDGSADRPPGGGTGGDDELFLNEETPPGGDQAPTAPSPQAASRPTVLRFIYFVEADQEFDPQSVEAIEQQAIALQAFWYEQFGGTFRLPVGGVEVIYGDHPADWYADTPDGDDERWFRLMNIRAELRSKLNLGIDSGDTRFIAFPSARLDGRVGANRYEGAWMDGDDIGCITGAVQTTPYTQDFPANCLGTVAHELGHVYGLGHEGADEDCMQFGFYHYVSGDELCDFSPENRRVVMSDGRNQAWLDAEPGDRG